MHIMCLFFSPSEIIQDCCILPHLSLPLLVFRTSVGIIISSQVVQFSALLVWANTHIQVHVHHSGRLVVEAGRNLIKRLASRLWDAEIGKEEEKEEKHCEDEEDVRTTEVSYVWEEHANDEVGCPVGTPCHCHSCGSWALREELCHKEPGDGARSHFKEGHKAKDGQHADVAHRRYTVQ